MIHAQPERYLDSSQAKDALFRWIRQLDQDLPLDLDLDSALEDLSGDAGFRRYFRLKCEPPLLAVYAPPDSENSKQFVAIANDWRAKGLRAPKVIGTDYEMGFLLIEDFGDGQLLAALDRESVSGYYGEALSVLLHLQVQQADRGLYPAYSFDVLIGEMKLFVEWYLFQFLGLELSAKDESMVHRVFEALANRAVSQKQVIVHRDYHSRNIMLLADGSLGLIDFQDAVLGPVTYDLVSLLKDCYIHWDPEQVEQWALAYAAMLNDAGVIDSSCRTEFLKDFHWMGMQRHIKVLGIFSRLYLRDDKSKFLRNLPLVYDYLLMAAEKYDEFKEFGTFLKRCPPSARGR